jgi:hypothetical protein
MFFLGFAITILLTLFEGVVLKVLWGWYLVPLGLPKISVIMAIGVSLIINMITLHEVHISDTEENKAERLLKRILFGIGLPTMYLLVGWFFHFFR